MFINNLFFSVDCLLLLPALYPAGETLDEATQLSDLLPILFNLRLVVKLHLLVGGIVLELFQFSYFAFELAD